MNLLAIDTATEACSAALYLDGAIAARYALAPREHARLILPMVDELLREADIKPTQLDAVSFGRGPGALTGLRIAAGVVQGIAYGADLPVVPVSSLAALAQGCYRERGVTRILATIDAGIGWAAYGDSLQSRLQEHVSHVEGARRPHAQDVALLAAAAYRRGETVSAAQAAPVYLRDEVAVKSVSLSKGNG